MERIPNIIRWLADHLKLAQASANRFEAFAILLLVAGATWPALDTKLAVLIPLFHGVFLFCAFLLVRHYLALIRPLIAHVFFALCVSVLTVEIAIHHYTSLHLNRFVLSLALQPQAQEQIGLSSTVLYLLALVAALSYLAARYLPWRFGLPVRTLVGATLASLIAAQALYGFLLFQRDKALLDSQRDLVFFSGIHHYYAETFFSPIFGPRPPNPYARSYNGTARPLTDKEAWTVRHSRNLLMVVVDSTRAMDIRADDRLAPNLMRLGERGYLSLDHSSVANCTHFGMHTLLSGDLATEFGQARHSGKAQGIFAALGGAGYSISSAEAQSLDWYDLARTYLPGAERTVAPAGSNAARDDFVAAETVARLRRAGDAPWAHLAYFSGPHFPYDQRASATLDAYRAAIHQTDRRIGQMLRDLGSAGLLANTLVIVTSDHGEEVFDNAILGHGSVLNDAQTKVPLLVLGATVRTDWIRSHRDILPLVRAEVGAGPLRALPRKTEVLTGCDYEIPKSFAIIDQGGRVDFRLEDGLLAPMLSPDGTMANKAQVQRAGLKLIEILGENE